MSRRSFRGDGRRLLLDTSFLLPVIGFETSNTVMRAFEKLRLYTLYYTDLSLLEASWKIVKVVKKGEE
ncbi:PIN domain nuclease, partial [Candidatus Bathyarchaeota archaeon]|nr:PIN domain nuclease [Candidatus Bathyarchaeota archaeon]